MKRYQRHDLIDWFDQKKMNAARAVVVGAGAVGNEVLKNLVLLGIGSLHVIDFDRIEEHNLTRSVLFRADDIGRYKAEVAAERCRSLDSNCRVTASVGDFWHTLRLSHLNWAQVVFCCVDNIEARLSLNTLCLLTGTDLVNAGIDSRHVSVELFPFSTARPCACFECTLPPGAYQRIRQRYSCGSLKKAAFQERKIPTTAVTSSLAGAAAVSMFLNRLNDHPAALQESVRLFQDTITFHTTLSSLNRSPKCPGCQSIADQHHIMLTARRYCAFFPNLDLDHQDQAHQRIQFSEPIVTTTRCRLCGREEEIFQSARELTDALSFCPDCCKISIEPEIIESLSLAELASVFGGRTLPCKYMQYAYDHQNFVIEMED